MTDISITYLDEVPTVFNKHSYIIRLLDDFHASNKPVMRVDIADHYKSIKVASSVWSNIIRKTHYEMRIMTDRPNNCIYVIKKTRTSDK